MSGLFTRPDERQAEYGLISLLEHKKVFLTCWCTKGSSFLASAQQGILSLLALYRFTALNFVMATKQNGH